MPLDQATVAIHPLEVEDEARRCAEIMVTSEPWVTLGRTYDAALRLLRDPTREVYVAMREDVLAGFVIVLMQGAFVGYIQTVAVAQEWRSKGIGSELIAFAEARIFRDAPNVFMCVSDFNHEAQALYQRLGYQRCGELLDYVVRGHSELLLRKSIGSLAEFKALVDYALPPSPFDRERE